MGDRSFVMVFDEKGKKKIAQYGQWNGFPEGIGLSVLSFLRDNNLLLKLKENLSKIRFLGSSDQDREFIEIYNENGPHTSNENDNRTLEQIKWWETYCHRRIADKILINIALSKDSEIILIYREDTAREDGLVEFSCVVDFSQNTFSLHYHVDETPPKVYDLNNLPTDDEFLSDFEGY